MKALKQHYNLVIVGGGMVGASLACLLNDAQARASVSEPLSILIIESFSLPTDKAEKPVYQPSFDARATALSFGTRKIYQQFGLWDKMAENVSAIDRIHVSDRGHWGSSLMDCESEGLPALGYIVENRWMGQVLLARLQGCDSVDWCCPASATQLRPQRNGALVEIDQHGELSEVTADLVVVADGARSPICKKLGIGIDEVGYGQSAIITNVSFTEPHQQVAYERFTDEGPMALLPLPDADGKHRSALVWTLPAELAGEWMEAPDQLFLEQLQKRFGYRIGRFTHVGQRSIYPLSLLQAKEQIRSGIVVLGNAAHALHPVAGQGYNLALRDVVALVDVLLEAKRNEEALGGLAVLERYMTRQLQDQQITVGFSDGLPKVFGIDQALVELARGLGLVAMDILPPAKTAFVNFAAGLGSKETRI